MKQLILEYLFQAKGQTVSGVFLSDALGISRVAVWKHIAALKEEGAPIESQARGYAIKDPEDLLMPFCFPKKYQDKVFHFHSLSSTMDRAKDMAKEGAPHLSVVVAEHQSQSRGRLNRKWSSDKGGLWFTLIVRPDLPPVLAYIYNFAASLSLSTSLKRLFDVNVSVKWPNDILLDGKKLAGILSEMDTRADMVEFLNIGIGLNVNNSPEKNEPRAIALKHVLKKAVPRRRILECFLDHFDRLTQNVNINRIMALWKKETSTIGTRVRIETLGSTFEGMAQDVDETGALIIMDDRGHQQKIIYGDCFYR